MSKMIDRIIRASKLDVNLYEEVEADKGAMGQAMGVVVLSSLAAGIGSIGKGGLLGILIGAVLRSSGGISGPISPILLGRKFFQSHRPKQILVSCCVPLASQVLLV